MTKPRDAHYTTNKLELRLDFNNSVPPEILECHHDVFINELNTVNE